MEIGELTRADIDAVNGKSISRGILNEQPEITDYNYALRHEGKVLAIGGIRLINETTAWAWVDMSEDSQDFIISVYKVIKEWIEVFVEQKGVKRLQAYCECDFPKAKRLLEHLGFRQEAVMPCFVGKMPAYLYVKFYGVSE